MTLLWWLGVPVAVGACVVVYAALVGSRRADDAAGDAWREYVARKGVRRDGE